MCEGGHLQLVNENFQPLVSGKFPTVAVVPLNHGRCRGDTGRAHNPWATVSWGREVTHPVVDTAYGGSSLWPAHMPCTSSLTPKSLIV